MATTSPNQSPGAKPLRHLNHNALPLAATRGTAVGSAVAYLADQAEYYRLSEDDLSHLPSPLTPHRQPVAEGISYRLETEKTAGSMTAVVFGQTYGGLPVWEAGLSVTLDLARRRILASVSTAFDAIKLTIPKKWPGPIGLPAVEKALGLGASRSRRRKPLRIESERTLVYRFEARKRTLQPLASNNQPAGAAPPGEAFVLPLAPLPQSIKDGAFYFVRELIFHYPLPSAPTLLWRAFVEVETGAVLLLRAFGDNVTGKVFTRDPITKGAAVTPSSPAATLDLWADSVTLDNLDPPAGGVQPLHGSLVSVNEVEGPTVAPPTTTTPFDFSFGSRTNNFGAVNTYYHSNGLLQLILDMGFGLGYFGGTVLPVPCDHRGLSEPKTTETAGTILNAINAHCLGSTTGITSVDFALGDVSDVTIPVTAAQITGDHLSIAADGRVALHEIGGHGVLYCHVGSANFGFAHSAGDSVAVILNDPGSTAPDRFESFPFTFSSFPLASRRFHNRTPAAGWGWEGSIALNPFDLTLDRGGYNNEQILSTTLFRLYRSMGGDSSDLNRQSFAARFAVYLIFQAIGSLTPTTNPSTALGFELALENADAPDWSSLNPLETYAGGAYLKVIRWAFEKQGLFQLAGTATPNNDVGSPPAVDVYIDDGRHGEYDYQPNHWSCQDIWNRQSIGDGGGVHEEPIIGQTNYAYVRIKNRGYQAATGIVVKGFHCFPGVGLTYPTDWAPMDTPQLAAPDLAANDPVGEIVGPFDWVPSQLGHECLFFSVSATGDPGNIDGRVTGPIPEWRLVPHDNNIGQRNVAPVMAGLTGLVASFARRPFWIRNTFDREVTVEIQVQLPAVLQRNDWQLRFVSQGGPAFAMKAGERRKVLMEMVPGTAADVNLAPHDRIEVTVRQDGIVVGGMSYYVDPSLRGGEQRCAELAGDLIKCLDLPRTRIKSVKIRRVNVDIDYEDGDC
jgi:zinc metalloprotease ZmpB